MTAANDANTPHLVLTHLIHYLIHNITPKPLISNHIFRSHLNKAKSVKFLFDNTTTQPD